MLIEVNESTYNLIVKESKKANIDIGKYLEDLMKEVSEIIPTKEEKKLWKGYLYDSLLLLAEIRSEVYPKKKDNLETLKEKFFYWASEYNDGYFLEQDEVNTDRYCAWLVQEYEKYC